MKKLVYLHIPKSGGTSQRTIFFDFYGVENVYWHATGHQTGARSAENTVVVGGHQKISFYPSNLDALYVSAVREPVDRIVSLFSYFVRPDLAGNALEWVQVRERQKEVWLDRGMDAESIVNSVSNSPQFREQVRNEQCAYLSRYEPTFDGVLRTLEEYSFVIGDLSHFRKFNECLSSLLGWEEVPHRDLNRSRASGNLKLKNEPGLKDALEELVREDRKLYRYIQEVHQGLYSNVDMERVTLSPVKSMQKLPVTGQFSASVNVYTKGYIGMDSEGVVSGSLVLVNEGALSVATDRYPDFKLEISLLETTGRVIEVSPQINQPVDVEISPGKAVQWNLYFKVPEYLVARKIHSIQIRAVLDPTLAAKTHNPLLDGTAVVMSV